MAHVLIACPTDGTIKVLTSLFVNHQLQFNKNVALYKTVFGLQVDCARNYLVGEFMKNEHLSHLFFVDSDVVPSNDCIDKLLALNVPIATGCYPYLGIDGLIWLVGLKDKWGIYQFHKELPDEPFEIDVCGAGCLLIRRDVFDSIEGPWFKFAELESSYSIRHYEEDIYFCEKAKAANLKIICDPRVKCGHFKTVDLKIFMEQ
jgi:hypothetical protein